jgi:hypothetical protein
MSKNLAVLVAKKPTLSASFITKLTPGGPGGDDEYPESGVDPGFPAKKTTNFQSKKYVVLEVP